MVQESWPENGPKIWATHRASASNLDRAHFSATKLWPKNGLKMWTAFFSQKQTQNHELGRGLAHPSSARPSVESRQPDAPNHVENTSGPRMTNFNINNRIAQRRCRKRSRLLHQRFWQEEPHNTVLRFNKKPTRTVKHKRQPARAET